MHAFNGKGNALNYLGRHDEAMKCFDKAIELDPSFLYAHNGKGIALNALGTDEAAEIAI